MSALNPGFLWRMTSSAAQVLVKDVRDSVSASAAVDRLGLYRNPQDKAGSPCEQCHGASNSAARC